MTIQSLIEGLQEWVGLVPESKDWEVVFSEFKDNFAGESGKWVRFDRPIVAQLADKGTKEMILVDGDNFNMFEAIQNRIDKHEDSNVKLKDFITPKK